MTTIVDLNTFNDISDPILSQSPLPSLLELKIYYLHEFTAEWEFDNVVLSLVLIVTN